MSTLSILDQSGDTKTTWAPEDDEALAQARTIAQGVLKETGGAIIRTDAPGGAEVVKDLKPEGEYVVVPQFAGG